MCNMCHLCLFAYYIVCRGSSINYVRTCLTHPSPMSALFIPVCCHFFLNVLPIIPKKCWRTLWTSPSTTPACCCSWVIHIWCHQIFLTYIPHSSSMSTLFCFCVINFPQFLTSPSQRWRPRLWKAPCMNRNRKTRIVIVVALLQTHV